MHLHIHESSTTATPDLFRPDGGVDHDTSDLPRPPHLPRGFITSSPYRWKGSLVTSSTEMIRNCIVLRPSLWMHWHIHESSTPATPDLFRPDGGVDHDPSDLPRPPHLPRGFITSSPYRWKGESDPSARRAPGIHHGPAAVGRAHPAGAAHRCLARPGASGRGARGPRPRRDRK